MHISARACAGNFLIRDHSLFSPIGQVVLEIWQNMLFLKLKFPTHFKKEGKMERKENGCFGWKWQPVAQATGAYGLQN